jgi:predicted  nucleic acid-binding Zn-ribbon protein
MRKVDVLRDLQEVDTALDQARARLARIAEEWGRRARVDAAAAARDEAQGVMRHLHAEQKDLELQVDKLQAKLKADSDKLYSGRVTNPKELEALSHEVEQDRRLVSSLEDRLLALLDDVEAAEAAAAAAEAAHAEIEATWKRQQAELAESRRALEAESTRLNARRTEVAAQSDAASLRTYDGLRRTRGGLAVVPVQQRTCQGCRITLPSSEEQKARLSNDLVTCNSCGRILYAGG